MRIGINVSADVADEAAQEVKDLARDFVRALHAVEGAVVDGLLTSSDGHGQNVRELAPVAAQDEAGPVATDPAAKLAAEHGVDLSQVAGSGAGGQITKGDVQAHVDAREKA